MVEFREKVFLDMRWELGIFLGLSPDSNEKMIGLSNGSVIKAQSIARVVEASRWDFVAVNKIRNIPGDHAPSRNEGITAGIEESATPHTDGDGQLREEAEAKEPKPDKSDEVTRKPHSTEIHLRITKQDLRRYGHTEGCQRCADLQTDEHLFFRHQSDD